MNNQYKHQLKKIAKMLVATSFIVSPFVCHAEETVVTDNTGSSSDTATLLNNLGLYIGFQLDSSPQNVPSTTTPDLTDAINSQFYAGISYIAALPYIIDVANYPGITYVPNASPVNETEQYSLLTNVPVKAYSVWANMGTAGSISSTKASAIYGINQSNNTDEDNPTYYSNMTSQFIYDLLTTPDYTYCTENKNNDTQIYTMEKCKEYGLKNMAPTPFTSFEVSNSILAGGQTEDGDYVNYATSFFSSDASMSGEPTIFFSSGVNKPLVPQLNADTLLGPLMYNTEVIENSSDAETGYPIGTQETQAMAYVRYLSGMNLPSVLPTYSEYTKTYDQLSDSDVTVRNQALKAFYKYFLNLRTYAASMSVGISNLAGIMGSRMPNAVTKTSQAYDEYVMATRRVLDPDSSDSSGKATNKWMSDMENASPITMQREMLHLLAEINYQLYLSRKQDEKILLTLSAMELQYANGSRSTLSIVSDSGA